MKHIFVLLLTVLIFYSLAAEADLKMNLTTKFKIKETREGEIKLKASTEEIYTFLTKESLDYKNFYTIERFYAPIKSIKGGYYYKDNSNSVNWIDSYSKSWKFNNSSDVFSSDYKKHKLSFERKRKIGDQIMVAYDEEFWELAYLPVIEIGAGTRIESYKLEFSHPKNYEIKYDVFFPRDEFMHNISKPNKKNTIITFDNLYEEDDLDYFDYNGVYSIIFLRVFRDGKEITPFNLADFVKWYATKVDLHSALPETKKDLLRTELEVAISDRQKLQIIYEYVRDNFRYIASNENNHSFYPHKVTDILRNGYGDCKDKSYLLKSIAAQYGLEVDLTLLNTNARPEVDYYHFSLYNHMICSYTDSSGTIFMDPTGKYCHFGNLPYTDYEKYALILNEKNPRQQWVPKPCDEFDALLRIYANVDSLKHCKAEITLYNDDYIYAKSIYENYQKLEFENNLSNYLTSYFYKVSLDYFKFEQETENSIIFSAKADLREFVISTETKKYLQRTPFTIFDKHILDRSEDDFDLHVKTTSKLKLELELQTNGYQIKPDELLIGDLDMDYFKSKITSVDDMYLLDYEFNNSKMYYAAEEKQTLIDFVKKYMKNKKKMIVLKKEES